MAQTGSATLEEIVVTASRRSESVQDIPINIAALSGAEIEKQGMNNLADVARWVPGLTIVDQGSRGADILMVRGLNVDSLNASEFLDNTGGETVATYIGDIPVYIDLKLNDLERVEVLIGPQGTLYGAGTLGGAVRYIPKKPVLNEQSFEINGDLFSLSESDGVGFSGGFVANLPLIDGQMALRASLDYYDDPGFIDYNFLVREAGVSNPEPDFSNPADVEANLRREEDANDEQTVSGRVSLLWQMTDWLDGTLAYHFQNQESGGRTINHRDAFGTGEYESAHRFLEPNDRDNQLLSLELVADLGFAELTSATGYSIYEEQGQRDQTDLLLAFEYGYEDFPAFAAFTREDAEENRFNQEIRLVSTTESRFNWIAGFFFNRFENDAVSQEFTPGIPGFFGIVRPDNLEYIQITQEDLTEMAVFGEIGFQITDAWKVTFGGRWFDYENALSTGLDLPLLSGSPDAINVELQANKVEDDGTLFKFNTSYDFEEDIMVYFTVSEGYRIGGVNSIVPCPDPIPAGVQNLCALPDEVLIAPDTTLNYEIGVRSTWLDNRLVLNGSIYYIEWDDIQIADVTQNGALPITGNGGSARSQGFELAFQAYINENWSAQGTYAYTDAELTEDAAELVDGEDAFSGDRLAGSPEQQLALGITYTQSFVYNTELEVNYSLTAISDVYTRIGLRAGGESLPGFAFHNISATVSRDNWRVTGYIDNFTNKFAETSVRQTADFIREVGGFDLRRYYKNVARPLEFGVRFNYRF